jgi:glucose-1-phosphate thymidylyltransferase
MKIIVPMAGMGKRMRPHTLSVPKPLIKLAGKPVVQHLVEDLAAALHEPVEHIGFVVGRFGKDAEDRLLKVASELGATGSIHYQDEPLGTAHAILCARELLEGKVVVAFADTLFRASIRVNPDDDGVLWVKHIDDPSQFGVVKLDEAGYITDFIEKPKVPVSSLAMIGVYYFKEGHILRSELQHLIDANIVKGGEYQLPDALKSMTEKGMRFAPGEVDEWLDCGNKNATVFTHQRVLHHKYRNFAVPAGVILNNSLVIPPCYIGEGVSISNSVVGPYVSLGANSIIDHSILSNTIVQEGTVIENAVIENSMLGSAVTFRKNPVDVSIGDFNSIVS